MEQSTYCSLHRDILEIIGDDSRKAPFELKGVEDLDGMDMTSLLLMCNLYERNGTLGNWRDHITSTKIAEVLINYGMWNN